MRFVLGVLLVLCALLASGLAAPAGQNRYSLAQEDASFAYAPLAVVVGLIPATIDDAIAEARFDGTPDRARLVVLQLQAFVDGFQQTPTWPAGSAAEGTSTEAYLRAQELAHLMRGVPSDIGFMYRNNARCDSWQGNATNQQRTAWGREAWPSRGRLFLLDSRLGQLASEVQAWVDASPLLQAKASIAAFVQSLQPDYEGCLPPPETFFLDAFPNPTWPTAEVLLVGGQGTPTPGNAVRILSGGLALDAFLPMNVGGSFSYLHTVPLQTPLGSHRITATFSTGTATVDLVVERAPTSIRLSFPSQVLPGDTIDLGVHVQGPVRGHAADGSVELTGFWTEREGLEAGRARFSLKAPLTEGNISGVVRYRGDAYHEESEARFAIRVKAATLAPEPIHRPPRVADVGFDFGNLKAFLLLGPGLLGLFLFADLVAGRRERRLPGPVSELVEGPRRYRRRGSEGDRLPDEATLPWLLRAFVAFLQWLVRHGRADPSQTAREAVEGLRAYDANPGPVVRLFERARYGGYEEPEPLKPFLPRWIQLVWRRIRRA